jgi:sarcosine oxidase
MLSVAVVGAGCFGAWTALQLAAECRVTLVDAYGPGNSRSSSGGETRVVRVSYGDQEIYSRSSQRSLQLWKDFVAQSDPGLFRETGVLLMARDQDAWMTSTLETLARLGVAHEHVRRADLEVRWPQIDFADVAWAIYEPGSGVLLARRAVQALVREAERRGVRTVRAAVAPPPFGRARLTAITTGTGESIPADAFVFACGPWLPALFPDLLAARMFTTRQEVLYFGAPAGNAWFAPPSLPTWIDLAEEMYGVPDIDARGVKISVDRHGPPFDVDAGNRVAGETVSEVSAYLKRRFPALGGAPLLAAEVCQYENSGNGDFLIDRHPDFENVWLAGGGSGHGFKHGPVVGEWVSRQVIKGEPAEPRFQLATKPTIHRRAVF